MSNFCNHSIKFSFHRNREPNGNPEYIGVYADGKFIGNVKRAGTGGWDYHYTKANGEGGVGYVTGTKRDAAEMMCAGMGLLDGNFNAPPIPFDPNTFEGNVPTGYNIVVYETGLHPESGLILYGFDEIELFVNEFTKPAYAFIYG